MPNGADNSIQLGGKRVVLLLQGGGALGAYQVGAHEALAEACRRQASRIDWVAGISIGAINSSVIAGPKCGDACKELQSLWNDLLSPEFPPFDCTGIWRFLSPYVPHTWLERLEPKYWDWMWTAFNPFGQFHFFTSRVMNPFQNPWLLQWFGKLKPDQLAFYDTGRLTDTLDKHVDWNTINARDKEQTLLSLGAARVTDGQVVFFNSFDSPRWGPARQLNAKHVMASGALPPAFPPIQVDGDQELYWDGGLSSNTPIQELANELTGDGTRDTIVFLIDLWDRKGPVPQSMDEVVWRQKSIQFGSRKHAAQAVVKEYQLKIKADWEKPKKRLEVYQVMYEQPDTQDPQFAFSDADFSRTTFKRVSSLGYDDMIKALKHAEPVQSDPGLQHDQVVLYRYGTWGKWKG